MLDQYIGECVGINNRHQLWYQKDLLVGINIVITVKY